MSKKGKIQTIEELLEEALVPEDEQPYEIPENWVYYKFGSIIDIQGGTQPPKSQFVEEELEGYVRLIQIRDYKSDKYKVFIPQKKNLRIVNENDITIARYGASVGQIHTGLSGAINVALAKVIYPESIIDKNFLYWLLQTEYFQIPLKSVSRSAQAGFNKGDLEDIIFPLPPLSEQKRIVDKNKILFSKIDEAKHLIEEAKETFELRRAAMLDKIFNDSTSEYKMIGEISNVKGGKRLPKGESLVDYDTGFPYIKAGDLKLGTVIPDKIQYLLPGTHEKIKNYKVSASDVYITIVGACIGDVGIIPSEFAGANLTENAAKITNIQGFLPEYIAIWLSSREAQNEIKDSIASATLGKLSLTKIKELKVPIKNIEEQERAIKIYRSFLNKEEAVLNIIQTLDFNVMKQGILSKAFRGELGTNDPTDEPAIELLKEVLQEQLK